eukprot:CAMPEP_0167804314 /NCGR_PEP_ID=MMETSP0111_2-20121227/20402_1 /TAXON_ID=91324 /ORGANISM="Lotharella globosa, Strain CCCM811" /LENGTH=32 /DNA_ID= /DNA_START= /DNA_END= /DNA_ORIENTATION=
MASESHARLLEAVVVHAEQEWDGEDQVDADEG